MDHPITARHLLKACVQVMLTGLLLSCSSHRSFCPTTHMHEHTREVMQDRFHSFVPMMDKYSALTIGLTLITIGGLGLYETLAEGPSQVEAATELPPTFQPAIAGKRKMLRINCPSEQQPRS